MKIKFDVTTQELAIIQQVLENILPARCKVWVFGSRAKNQAKYNSDLDLAIEYAEVLDKTTLMRLETEFDESRLPYRVDIVDLNKAEPYFKEIVEQQKVEFPFKRKVPELRFSGFISPWGDIKIDQIAKVSSGGTPSRSNPNYWGGDIPWVTTSEIGQLRITNSSETITEAGLQNSSAKMFKKHSVLIAMYGQGKTRGQVSILGIEATTNQACAAISLSEGHSSKFIYYFLFKQYSHLRNLANDGSQKNLSSGLIKSYLVPFVGLEEQQKIAAFLTTIDEKLNKLRRKHELLNTYKRGLMQKIFSQEIRFKQDDGSYFPDWEDKKLKDIAQISGGGTPDTSVPGYWNGDINWFTPSEIKIKYLEQSKRKISESGLKGSSAKLLPVGALLLSTRATIGDVGIAIQPCTTNQGFQSLIVKQSECNEFWYYWLGKNKKELLRRASGSIFLEIGKSEMAKIPVKRPNEEEQQKIATCLTTFDQKIDAVTQQITQLETFKQGLLQKMFV